MNRGAVGILGVGAIGGSIGLRARREGRYVVGADANDAALQEALTVGAIDARAGIEEMPASVETYVIAAHLEPTLREIERLCACVQPMPALIVDVASVKVPVAHAAAALRNFVPTHPMAGTERSGVSAARTDLFDGRTWAYVPSGDDRLEQRVRDFIEAMGAVPFAVSPEDHDRAVALSSHVPQLVASSYARLVRSSDPTVERLCGPVAHELLRISNMSFDMWRDVLRANAANVEPQLRKLGGDLQVAADQLRRGEVESLAPLFGEPAGR